MVGLPDGTLELIRSIDTLHPLVRVGRLRAPLVRPSFHETPRL